MARIISRPLQHKLLAPCHQKSRFYTRLESKGIKIRHTRLGRPNDNAHIERFNRTLQEECTGNYYLESEPLKKMDDKILTCMFN